MCMCVGGGGVRCCGWKVGGFDRWVSGGGVSG